MKKFTSIFLAIAMVFIFFAIAHAEFSDGQFTGNGTGLNGDIEVSVTVKDGKISDIVVLNHSETAGICEPAIDQIPAAIIEKQSTEVDTVAGATFTSRGIMDAVTAALSGKKEEMPVEMPFEQPDLIVVGGGLAGIATTTRAAQLGLNVVMYEKTGKIGGTAMVAGGTLLGVNTKMQKDAGIEDSVDLCMADFYRQGYPGRFNEEVARQFAALTGPAVDWLDGLGCDFGDRQPFRGVYDPLNTPRNYSGNGGASAFVKALTDELEQYIGKNAYISLHSRVDSLVVDENGRVNGVNVEINGEMQKVLAPETVLATGGYGGSEEMLLKYNFDEVLSTAPRFVTGDGFKMLEDLDVILTNMDICSPYAGGIRTNPDDFMDFSYFNVNNGCIWVNIYGERMGNETSPSKTLKKDIWRDAPKNIVYTVFTPDMLIPGEMVFSTGPWGKNAEEFDPFMKKLLEMDLAFQADTIEALAKEVGLPEDTFMETVKTYNDACINGDDPFGRTEQLVPMKNGPFYAVKTIPYVMLSSGGPLTDLNARPIRHDGFPVEGLFICGEQLGTSNLGSIGGCAHGACITYGKLIPEMVAAELGK